MLPLPSSRAPKIGFDTHMECVAKSQAPQVCGQSTILRPCCHPATPFNMSTQVSRCFFAKTARGHTKIADGYSHYFAALGPFHACAPHIRCFERAASAPRQVSQIKQSFGNATHVLFPANIAAARRTMAVSQFHNDFVFPMLRRFLLI